MALTSPSAASLAYARGRRSSSSAIAHFPIRPRFAKQFSPQWTHATHPPPSLRASTGVSAKPTVMLRRPPPRVTRSTSSAATARPSITRASPNHTRAAASPAPGSSANRRSSPPRCTRRSCRTSVLPTWLPAGKARRWFHYSTPPSSRIRAARVSCRIWAASPTSLSFRPAARSMHLRRLRHRSRQHGHRRAGAAALQQAL